MLTMRCCTNDGSCSPRRMGQPAVPVRRRRTGAGVAGGPAAAPRYAAQQRTDVRHGLVPQPIALRADADRDEAGRAQDDHVMVHRGLGDAEHLGQLHECLLALRQRAQDAQPLLVAERLRQAHETQRRRVGVGGDALVGDGIDDEQRLAELVVGDEWPVHEARDDDHPVDPGPRRELDAVRGGGDELVDRQVAQQVALDLRIALEDRHDRQRLRLPDALGPQLEDLDQLALVARGRRCRGRGAGSRSTAPIRDTRCGGTRRGHRRRRRRRRESRAGGVMRRVSRA